MKIVSSNSYGGGHILFQFRVAPSHFFTLAWRATPASTPRRQVCRTSGCWRLEWSLVKGPSTAEPPGGGVMQERAPSRRHHHLKIQRPN
ncbi:hypothetical protein E2C01_045085 [Portunus trituberculatus]|uniref:Uncharacterized protein n=1 Tax=Portunus trituberculatus TaxID=210409 RepID=A0A5B7FUS9_PORTR|nr:hypothetical protein [Portunus trituberculatus]